MSATLKTLVIDPTDIGLADLGGDSLTGTIELSAHYDRRVEVDGHTILPAPTPAVRQSDGTWAFSVIANDDPAITRGKGFGLVLTATIYPRVGRHSRPTTWTETVSIASSDPATVTLASKGQAVAIPYYLDPANLSGVAWWTNPTTGEQVPVMVAPVAGTLTVLGGSNG